MGNLRKRLARKLRIRKWSFYGRRWGNTWFSGEAFSLRGLPFSDNHLWIFFRRGQRQLWMGPRVSTAGSHN
jgi:hypothetical protein